MNLILEHFLSQTEIHNESDNEANEKIAEELRKLGYI